MNVLLIAWQYPLYPGGSHLQEFVDALCACCDGVTLVAGRHPKGEFARPANLRVVWIPVLRVPVLGDLVFNLLVAIRALALGIRRFDVIHSLSVRGAPAARWLGVLARRPSVCTVEILNDAAASRADRIYLALQRAICRLRFDRIICWSAYYAGQLKSFGVPDGRIALMPAGIDARRYHPGIDGAAIRSAYPAGAALIVFAKPLYEYNRRMAEFLLRAVALLKDDCDIRLLLGRGEKQADVARAARELGLEERVDFMPFVPITEIPRYLAATDLAVLPFTYAATVSRSLLESMAMGKPVVTSDRGEVPRVVRDGIDGLVLPLEERAFADAIRRLLADPALRERLARSGRERVEQEYDVRVVAGRTASLYRELARERALRV